MPFLSLVWMRAFNVGALRLVGSSILCVPLVAFVSSAETRVQTGLSQVKFEGDSEFPWSMLELVN